MCLFVRFLVRFALLLFLCPVLLSFDFGMCLFVCFFCSFVLFVLVCFSFSVSIFRYLCCYRLFVCLLMVGCYIWRITWVSFKRNCGAASAGECKKII